MSKVYTNMIGETYTEETFVLNKTMPSKEDPSYDFRMRAYCDYHKFTFPVWCRNSGIEEMYKINPLKQAEVIRIIDILKRHSFVTDAWVIGSACNPMCTLYSDLDMIIKTTIPPNENPEYLYNMYGEMYLASENGMDILRLEQLAVDEPISYEIYWRAKVI